MVHPLGRSATVIGIAVDGTARQCFICVLGVDARSGETVSTKPPEENLAGI